METLWEKMKKSFVDGVSTAAEKTEEFTKIGRAKLDILAVKHKISKKFTELGGLVYDAVKAGKTKNAFSAPEIEVVIDSLKELENELNVKEAKLEEMKKKPEPESKTNTQQSEEKPNEPKSKE